MHQGLTECGSSNLGTKTVAFLMISSRRCSTFKRLACRSSVIYNVYLYRWNVFRSLYERKEIWIWSFYRGLRGTFLVTSDPEKPYSAPQSFELRRLRSLLKPGFKPLPAMIEAMASNEGKPLSAETIADDKNKYAILSSNGVAWEMNGVLQVPFL